MNVQFWPTWPGIHPLRVTAHIWATTHTETPTLTKSKELISWSVAQQQVSPSD